MVGDGEGGDGRRVDRWVGGLRAGSLVVCSVVDRNSHSEPRS